MIHIVYILLDAHKERREMNDPDNANPVKLERGTEIQRMKIIDK